MPAFLHPEPLTPQAFAAYGTVVAPFAHGQPPAGARAINGGTTWRLDLLADLDLHQSGGTPGLAVYSAAARTFPLALEEMERHTQGSQSFLPLGNARFVVVVAPAGAAPNASNLKAFITNGQQGVVLHPGTWHHGLVAVEAGSFAVVERHGVPGAAVDCDVVGVGVGVWLDALTEPISISHEYPELMHYTTGKGLQGILSSDCIWATDARHLNDPTEIKHFFEVRLKYLINEETRKYVTELASVPKNLAKIMRDGGLGKVIEAATTAWLATLQNVTMTMNRPFVSSFCGIKNTRTGSSGLLSQWRGYGRGGGYAVVFDTHALESMLNKEAQSHHYMQVQFGDVFYYDVDINTQPAAPEVAVYEAIIRQGVSKLIRGGTAEETEGFYEAVTSLSCLYKHWGFHEEREVRVVVIPASDEVAAAGEPTSPPRKEIKSFIRSEQPVSYVELFTQVAASKAPEKLPIRRVIIGPHKDSELRIQQVKDLLARYGYPIDIDVVRSEIPYIET